MNDPKAAAAYHPGDAPVVRPDLDALIANLREDPRGLGLILQETMVAAADSLEAERARADQAMADGWDEGYETGCEDRYGTSTPGGQPYDPTANPYRQVV